MFYETHIYQVMSVYTQACNRDILWNVGSDFMQCGNDVNKRGTAYNLTTAFKYSIDSRLQQMDM